MSGNKDKILKNRFTEIKDIIDNSYIAEIADIDKLSEGNGAIKLKIYGLTSSEIGEIKTENLPYAYPLLPLSFGSKNGGGAYSTPKIGVKVRVIFMNDFYHQRYFAPETLTSGLKKLIKDNPNGVHSLLYDEDEEHDIQIHYTKKSGFLIDLKRAVISISDDADRIYFKNKDSNSEIEMQGSQITILSKGGIDITCQNNCTVNAQTVHVNGDDTKIGANPIYANMNGEPMMILLKGLATIINAKLPIDATALTLVNQLEKQILSKTVTTTP